jgi:type IV secretion system protein VirB2
MAFLINENTRFLVFVAMFSLLSLSAFAAAGNDAADMEAILCNAYGIFNGPIGRTFAVFAIVALGVGFFLGKVSWGTAIAIALGIGAIFGAPAMVGLLLNGIGTDPGLVCADATS